jgi:UDP-N-acetylglucosamine--N-acetylmuramyl-(pentapeptide) pyrophosphoryl-undecaprenol N-acetylglucosamine transferase
VLGVDRTAPGRARSRAALGIAGEGPLVGIVGGSLGARRLNDAALGLAGLMRARGDAIVYHVCGRRSLAEVTAAAAAAGLIDRPGLEYRVVAYEDRLAELFAAADVVVGRAGASTVAELAVIGTPSILVPLPGSPSDHQAKNAAWLCEAGAAVLLGDDEASGERVFLEVAALLDDPARLGAMGEAARRVGRRDAARAVASLVVDVAAGRWTKKGAPARGGAGPEEGQ